jgi:hypothetical protein
MTLPGKDDKGKDENNADPREIVSMGNKLVIMDSERNLGHYSNQAQDGTLILGDNLGFEVACMLIQAIAGEVLNCNLELDYSLELDYNLVLNYNLVLDCHLEPKMMVALKTKVALKTRVSLMIIINSVFAHSMVALQGVNLVFRCSLVVVRNLVGTVKEVKLVEVVPEELHELIQDAIHH